MPQALTDIDRELVKALVMQGLRQTEIIRQTGVKPKTLSTWINRYGWMNLASKANSIREGAVQGKSNEDRQKSLVSVSDSTRSALAGRITLHAQVLAAQKAPRTSRQVQKEAEAMRPVVQNGKDVFGWADGSITQTFNIALLTQAERVEPGTVIDAESTPVLPDTKPASET